MRTSASALEAGVLVDGRLTDFLPADDGGEGEVHLGRIVRIDRGLGAAAVETVRGEGWLDLAKAKRALPDHPLTEGAAIVVRITRAAAAGKGPRVSADLSSADARGALSDPGATAAGSDRASDLREAAARAKPPQRLHVEDPGLRIRSAARALGAQRIVAHDHMASLKLRRLLAGSDEVEVEHEPGAWQAVVDQLREALDRRVVLPQGVTLVIEPTSALTVIDVNGHGRTPLEIDVDAAFEIARQVRLRRLGGIIVIDFIDLRRPRERDRLHRTLCEAFISDPAPVDILPMTRLGLVQMTRKRIGPSLAELLSEPCPTCAGEGRVVPDRLSS